ncbi:MAG: stage II sporulation protein M, partial [Myxococcota bacterium]
GISWSLVASDPAWYETFVPSGLSSGRTPWTSKKELERTLTQPKRQIDQLSVFSSFLFVHNTRVGLTAFGLGFLLGIPTIFLMFYNGLVLGAFVYIYASKDLLLLMLGWLLPHGIPEILAILLCGTGGLMLGRAVLLPGRFERGESLRRAGMASSLLVFGAVVLLFYAAIVEGFFRQIVVDQKLRLALIVLNLLLLGLWIGVSERMRTQRWFKEIVTFEEQDLACTPLQISSPVRIAQQIEDEPLDVASWPTKTSK